MTSPSESTPADLQREVEFSLYGAVTATRAVLPRCEAGAGTLLFTTGAGSINPVPMLGNVNAAAAGGNPQQPGVPRPGAGGAAGVGRVARLVAGDGGGDSGGWVEADGVADSDWGGGVGGCGRCSSGWDDALTQSQKDFEKDERWRAWWNSLQDADEVFAAIYVEDRQRVSHRVTRSKDASTSVLAYRNRKPGMPRI